jgi:hypothetical protein
MQPTLYTERSISLFSKNRIFILKPYKMKKLLLTALILFTFFLGAAQHAKHSDRVKVDDLIKPHFERFVSLMEEHNIPVDYDCFDSIEVIPLMDGVQGIWLKQSRTILLNYYFYLPVGVTYDEKLDLIFITLAHEIGHALGS